jgi:hypothetical protein
MMAGLGLDPQARRFARLNGSAFSTVGRPGLHQRMPRVENGVAHYFLPGTMSLAWKRVHGLPIASDAGHACDFVQPWKR